MSHLERNVDVRKSDDGKNIFRRENISLDCAKINWDEINKQGKRITQFYGKLRVE
jgi:hypothetical protein